MIDQNFIYEEIARIFGVPCKWSAEMEEHMKKHSEAWCKKFCGKVDASKCVRQFMRTRELEEKKWNGHGK